MSSTAQVEFVPLRSDLANLPSDLASTLFNSNSAPQNIVVELTWQKGLSTSRNAYLGWTGMTAEKSQKIEVDPTFAQNIGLPYGTKVQISIHINPPVASQIYLDPATTADWEIVETHAAFLENWMINQVRAVSLVHPITVYPSNTAIACLQVTKISPNPVGYRFAKLGPDSEVIIAPKLKKVVDTQANGIESPKKKKVQPKTLLFRTCAFPYTDIESASTSKLVLYGNIPLQSKHVSVTLVNPAGIAEQKHAPNGGSEDTNPPAKTVVATFVHADTPEPILSYGLLSALRAKTIGSVVRVQEVSSSVGTPQDIVIHPYNTGTAASKSLKLGHQNAKASESDTLDVEIVSPGLLLPPSTSLPQGGIIECSGEGPIKSQTIGEELAIGESQVLSTVEQLVAKPARKVAGMDSVLEKIAKSCSSGSNTLIFGSRSSGKTVSLEHVIDQLQHIDLIYIARFNCNEYLDKPLSVVREALKRLFLEASWHAPGVVLMDDLDKLLPAQLEHADSSRTQQLSEIFIGLVHSLLRRSNRKVALLASSQSKEALSASILNSHVFDERIHIKSPDKQKREAILLEALRALELETEPNFDILEVVGDTEGYQPGDLWTLVERIMSISSLAKIEGEDAIISTQTFKRATEEFVPASLRGVKLQKSNVSWSEIGGLKEVKRVILETLEWPTKYAPIFANCPLRLRSGLLLYGYPGCGKTLMASAVAAQCGLNFISVKGPEILNKYIGASEQSVRDLFDRAQAAKPCVLFFDEFDSIAPKRGHDSTGVTDRVVNQMLTQMDGAEGLDGVYVLAATSRPDLIDGALLRPGRLDKSLLCDMPSFEDRLEILQTAQVKMDLAEDVDLEDIARATQGFSGADMQAIMTNAYLDAIHSTIENSSDQDLEKPTREVEMFHIGDTSHINLESVKNYALNSFTVEKEAVKSTQKAAKVKVSAANLAHSLSTTKPSISQKEVRKLRGVYDKFVADRDGQMPTGTPSADIGGRVTLQ